MEYEIKDKKLSSIGKNRIEWAFIHMPVLREIMNEFSKSKPLKGIRISACLHVTTETANLMRTLKEGGAEIRLCASNPLSTQNDVAASLVVDYGIPVFAIKGEDNKSYYSHINSALNIKPHITMDDGGDLTSTVHKNKKASNILGGTEETTTGVTRLKSMAEKKLLLYPIIAVNDSKTKYLFDNRYGTGQSTIDGILRATNILLAGKNIVVCGYGWCGRGIATKSKGMGANVIITEINPIRAIEAKMDGFRVMKIEEAAKIADIIITATGNKHVIDKKHFELMKDGVILANAGHFDVEINIVELKKMAKTQKTIKEYVKEFTINGKKIYLLADGRLVNLSAAEGHPSEVMDMSFANQAFAVKYLVEDSAFLEKKVYTLPEEIDIKIAKMKLKTMNIEIDKLTKEQEIYLKEWKLGT